MIENKVKKIVKFCMNNTKLINPKTLLFNPFLKRILRTKGWWIFPDNNFDYPQSTRIKHEHFLFI